MTRQALTAEMIAQIAAGATPAAAAATQAAPSVVVPAAAAATTEGIGLAAPAAAVEAPAAAAAPSAAVEAAAAAPAVAVAAPADVTGFLQAQVATKDAALLTANVEIAGLKAKIADSEASISGLKAIAADSISNMRVALGGSKTDMSALSATELLASHAAAKTEFQTKFVAGGVAAVDAAQAAKPDAKDTLVASRLDKISA